MATTVSYKVAGMSCGGCANKVKNNVSALDEVLEVNVDLPTGNVDVTFAGEVHDESVVNKIEELGYSVVE